MPERAPRLERTLRVGEVADYLDVTTKRVYGWIDDGVLPALRLPGRNGHVTIRIRRQDLDDFDPKRPRPVRERPSSARKLLDRITTNADDREGSGAFVYFLRIAENGPIKIGTAIDPSRRIKGLQAAHHRKLVLLGTMRGGSRTEREIHRAFKTSRLSGEWFRTSKRLLAFIAEATDG